MLYYYCLLCFYRLFSLMFLHFFYFFFFFFNDPATTEIYTLSLHDALPIFGRVNLPCRAPALISWQWPTAWSRRRSEEHTSELQSRGHLVCRLLLEKKKKNTEKLKPSTMTRPQYSLNNVTDGASHELRVPGA